MDRAARLLTPPLRLVLALFAVYALWTIPSLLPRWGASAGGFALLAGWLGLAAIAWPIARGRWPGRGFWPVLAGVAIVLRLAALALVAGRTPIGDPAIYVQLARELLAGGPLLFRDGMTGTDFHALYPPAYPLFLAGLGAVFGLGQGVVWAGNVAFDLAAALLLAHVGARLGQRAAGRAAAWLFVVWPTFVLAAPLAQKEPAVLVLVLGIVALLLRLKTRPAAWREGAGLGLLAGVLALTQPGLALYPGVVGLLLLPWLGWRRLWAIAWRAAPIALAVMLPWWWRNWTILHHFVPLTSTGGLGLWIGNNPDATGNWMPVPDAWRGLGEVEMSARGAAEAKAWIAAHTADFVRLTLTKTVRTMGVEQFTMLRFSLLRPAPGAALAAALFPLAQGALFAVLAGAAAGAGRVRRAAGGAVVLLLAVAALAEIALFGVWFEFAERHRYFLMPFLFLVVGAALATIGRPAIRAGA